MTFAEDMYSKSLNDTSFSEMKSVLDKIAGELPFPLEKPYVSFGTEYENASCLLGNGDSMVIGEVMVVNVAVSEEFDENYCRERAREVALAVMKLDTGKRIMPVTVGRCEYNDTVGCYNITIKFGLREVRRNGGD